MSLELLLCFWDNSYSCQPFVDLQRKNEKAIYVFIIGMHRFFVCVCILYSKSMSDTWFVNISSFLLSFQTCFLNFNSNLFFTFIGYICKCIYFDNHPLSYPLALVSRGGSYFNAYILLMLSLILTIIPSTPPCLSIFLICAFLIQHIGESMCYLWI